MVMDETIDLGNMGQVSFQHILILGNCGVDIPDKRKVTCHSILSIVILCCYFHDF